jgi:hypothetical protein
MIQNPFGDPNERADIYQGTYNGKGQSYVGQTGAMPETPNPYFASQPPSYGQELTGATPQQNVGTWDINNTNAPEAPKVQTWDMDPNQMRTKEPDKVEPTSAPKKPSWFKSNSGDLGRGIIATMNKINANLEKREAKKSEEEDVSRGKYSGDKNFIEKPTTSSSKGNWAINGQAEGMLRPDQYVPVEYLGYDAGNIRNTSKYGGTSHKKNTELYMTEDELEKFLKAGGQVEYLD